MIFQAMKLCLQHYSTVVPKHRKFNRILQYFRTEHGYEATAEVVSLRSLVEDHMKKSPTVTDKIDLKLCARLGHLNTDNILSLFNVWSCYNPDSLTKTVFYQAFFKSIRNGMWKVAPWNHLIQIIHFVGCQHGDPQAKSLMILFLHTVNESPIMAHCDFRDICIVCEAAYRTRTTIPSTNIRTRLSKILEEQAFQNVDESIWFVMIIKMMNYSKFYDRIVLQTTAQRWISEMKIREMPFTVQCYVMSLYANAGLKEDYLFKLLVTSAGKKLIETPELIRVKDLFLMLRSLSHLDIPLHLNFIEDAVMPCLLRELDRQNDVKRLGILIQSCISLWNLGALPRIVTDRLVSTETLGILTRNKTHGKELSNLALLLDIIEAQSPKTLTEEQSSIKKQLSSINLLVPDIEKELKKRPQVVDLSRKLNEVQAAQVKTEYILRRFIAGVTFRHNGTTYHADVLDESNCLADSITPNGRLKAKARLMNLVHTPVTHVLIKSKEIQAVQRDEDWITFFQRLH